MEEQAELQNINNERYAKEEPLRELVIEWVRSPDGETEGYRNRFQTKELAAEALQIAPSTLNRSTVSQLSKILRNIGYKNKKVREGKIVKNVWIKITK